MTIIDQFGSDSDKMVGLRYPKALLWGDMGEGKTVSILYVMRELGLKMVGIDADGGLGAYAGMNWPMWRNVPIEDPLLCCQMVHELLTDPQDYQLLAIDPVTTLWRHSQDESDRYERSRKGKHTLSVYAPVLHQASWGPIKKLAFRLTNDARRLGMALIVTARETALYRKMGSENVQVGVKPDYDKNLGYEFDIVIHMQSRGEGGPREAVVNKDRWNLLPPVIQGEARDIFYVAKALVGHYGDKFTQNPVANPRATRDQIDRLFQLQQQLKLDQALIPARLKEVFGVVQYSELTPDQADKLIGLYNGSS